MRRVLIGLPAAALVLLLSACGDPNAPANNAPTPSSAAPTSTAAPTATATAKPVPPPVATPSVAGKVVTLEGVVEAGVEPGCKILKTGTGQYLLLGDVPLGVEVRVTGVAAAGVSTTCQQGTPLRVTKVERK
jgi:hypothetical protein